MTVKDAAAHLEVCPATIYSLVSAGKLKCYRIGNGRGAIRIANEHIEEFLAGAQPIVKQTPPPAQKIRLKHIRL